MERVAIILRKSQVVNRFRSILLGCFSNDNLDEHLICSGFFQERGKYFASNCFIASAPKFPCNKKVSLVGVYNKIWSGDFDNFAIGLSTIGCSCGSQIQVIKRKIKRYHWHAKVYVASKSGIPVVGIIGSSNITVRAFGIRQDWNYEADVVLWNADDPDANAIVLSALESREGNEDGFGIIVSNYASDDPINRGLTMEEKLKSLINDINMFSEIIE